MGKVIEAIYENGVFKPLEKIDLPEKTKLRIKIKVVKPSGILEIAKETCYLHVNFYHVF